MLNLDVRSTSERSPGQFVSMLAELNVESKLSVHGVSRNFAAIYGANYGQVLEGGLGNLRQEW